MSHSVLSHLFILIKPGISAPLHIKIRATPSSYYCTCFLHVLCCMDLLKLKHQSPLHDRHHKLSHSAHSVQFKISNLPKHACFLDCGRKTQIHTEKKPLANQDSNPGSSRWEVTVLTTQLLHHRGSLFFMTILIL